LPCRESDSMIDSTSFQVCHNHNHDGAPGECAVTPGQTFIHRNFIFSMQYIKTAPRWRHTWGGGCPDRRIESNNTCSRWKGDNDLLRSRHIVHIHLPSAPGPGLNSNHHGFAHMLTLVSCWPWISHTLHVRILMSSCMAKSEP
jgi:hypothetical protein